jgi:hypothetical protein
MVLLADHYGVKATLVKGLVVWLMRYKKPGLCRYIDIVSGCVDASDDGNPRVALFD